MAGLKFGVHSELKAEANPVVPMFRLPANIVLGTGVQLGKNQNLLTSLST